MYNTLKTVWDFFESKIIAFWISCYNITIIQNKDNTKKLELELIELHSNNTKFKNE
jgi:hypothetical protein